MGCKGSRVRIPPPRPKEASEAPTGWISNELARFALAHRIVPHPSANRDESGFKLAPRQRIARLKVVSSAKAGTPSKVTDASAAAALPRASTARLVLELLRPYRGWLLIVLAAMMVEIAMSLLAPWPLKLVLDDALGNHKLPEWAAWVQHAGIGNHTMGVALFAGLATLIIAVVGAVATYIDNYYTASIGQWVANDLRVRIYAQLHRLSLGYYDSAKTGTLMSTITGDVSTV